MESLHHRLLATATRIQQRAKKKNLPDVFAECEAYRKYFTSSVPSLPQSLHIVTCGLHLDHDGIAEECLDIISSMVVNGLIRGGECFLREVPANSEVFGRSLNVVLVHALTTACDSFHSERVQIKAIECLVTAAIKETCDVRNTLLVRTVQALFNLSLQGRTVNVLANATQKLKRVLKECVVGRVKAGASLRCSLFADEPPLKFNQQNQKQHQHQQQQQDGGESVSGQDEQASNLGTDGGTNEASLISPSSVTRKTSNVSSKFVAANDQQSSPPPSSPGHPTSMWLRQQLQNLFKTPSSATFVVPGERSEVDVVEKVLSVPEQDYFIILRQLCELCCVEIPASRGENGIEVRTRLLALESVVLMLQHGVALPQCFSLLSLCKPHITRVFYTNLSVTKPLAMFDFSQQIGAVIVQRFHRSMRGEVAEVLRTFRHIILSPVAPFHHIAQTMTCLCKLVATEGLMVDLYINCDCLINHDDVASVLLDTMLRATQLDVSRFTPSQAVLLRRYSLDGLRSYVHTLNHWVVDPRSAHRESSARDLSVTLSSIREMRERKLTLATCLDVFNCVDGWKDGLSRLEQHNIVVPRDGRSLAVFLRFVSGVGLVTLKEVASRVLKTEHLGETFQWFCHLLPLRDVSPVTAVDRFASMFPIQVKEIQFEGMVWDGLLARLGTAYAVQNPELCLTASAGDVLCNSILSLHSNLHNVNVKGRDKMKEDFWCSCTAEAMGGGVWTGDSPLLHEAYAAIGEREWVSRSEGPTFKMTDETVNGHLKDHLDHYSPGGGSATTPRRGDLSPRGSVPAVRPSQKSTSVVNRQVSEHKAFAAVIDAIYNDVKQRHRQRQGSNVIVSFIEAEEADHAVPLLKLATAALSAALCGVMYDTDAVCHMLPELQLTLDMAIDALSALDVDVDEVMVEANALLESIIVNKKAFVDTGLNWLAASKIVETKSKRTPAIVETPSGSARVFEVDASCVPALWLGMCQVHMPGYF
eukprot:PhM_4_TR18495/c0_g1_i1/m.11634